MSDIVTYADNTVLPWIQNNRWPQTETPDQLLVISVPVAASSELDGPIVWHSGVAGIFEVKTAYDRNTHSLQDTSIQIEVPGFGHATTFPVKQILLEDPQPIQVHLADGGVSGTVTFSYDTPEKKAICAAWNLRSEYGTFDDRRSLFPTERSSPFLANKLQNLKVITDSEVSALREAPQPKFKVVRDSLGRESLAFEFDHILTPTEEQQIAASFIHGNVAAGNPIVTVPVLSAQKSDGTTLDLDFLGVFLLEGTISSEKLSISVALDVKIPLLGRIMLAEIAGQLIDSGVTANIDLSVAQGSITLAAFTNTSGTHDLYLENFSLSVKFLGKFSATHLKLLTLPF